MNPHVSDEWIFSLRIPGENELNVADAERQRDAASTSAATDAPPPPHAASNLVQLKQAKPGRRKGRPASAEAAAAAGVADDRENSSLLDDEEQESLASIDSSLGWTFQSPFWGLSVRELLRVTYFPAWQALPAYTNTRSFAACCGAGASSSSSSSSCCGGNPIDYSTFTYTTADVVSVRHVGGVHVPGVGMCRGVQLRLRSFERVVSGSFYYDSVPDSVRVPWLAHLAQVQQSRQSRGLPVPPVVPSDVIADGDGSRGPIITFCLPSSQDDPPLLWKVTFPPVRNRPVAIEALTVFDGALIVDRNQHPSPTHIYINGYQSWSFAGSVPRGHAQPTSAMPNVLSRAFNFGGSVPPPAEVEGFGTSPSSPPLEVQYTSDFFTCVTSDGHVPNKSRVPFLRHPKVDAHPIPQLDETGGPALLLGWLSQRKHFGVVTGDKDLKRFQMHCSSHGQLLVDGVTDAISTDWAYAQLISSHSYDEEPMASFLHAAAGHNQARPLQNGSLLTGWCSWYFAYEKISSRLLRDNFAKLAGLKSIVPTNVSVVDDGYMLAWGDWDQVKPLQFPEGMATVSRDISDHGMRPGLWMAPFAADKHSKIAARNPDWVIRNHAGYVANSSNCGKFFYGLDATNPSVRDYVHHCVSRAVEAWGFHVLKIDFLYAACLEGNGKFDLSMSRAEAMDVALKTIRHAAGSEAFLIACGCPIASAIGFADAMRISADTGPTWYPPPPLPWWDNGTLPCLRSMIRNSITRAPFGHRWWHNDPDCLMFGEHTRLSSDEIASAASIVAMTCGMLLLSDDLPKVPESRTRIMSKIFPMTGASAIILDLHSTNNGLPNLMRLWCTDRFDELDQFRRSMSGSSTDDDYDHNEEATYFARKASFRPDEAASPPEERERSCIHVTNGLGTWTVLSVSNWHDKPAVVHVPSAALLPAPEVVADVGYGEFGYHVFEFWSSRYSWLPPFPMGEEGDVTKSGHDRSVNKLLGAHATEIFHIKPVTPDTAQYVGSDLHFSCGRELRSFRVSRDQLEIRLISEYKRSGRVFVFLPRTSTENVRVTVRGAAARWMAVGNTPKVGDNGSPRLLGRVIAILIAIRADGFSDDGHVQISF